MSVVRQARRRRWAAQILESGLSPVDKERKLVALGYDEADADAMIHDQQLGTSQPVYYEQLPNPEYDKDYDRDEE